MGRGCSQCFPSDETNRQISSIIIIICREGKTRRCAEEGDQLWKLLQDILCYRGALSCCAASASEEDIDRAWLCTAATDSCFHQLIILGPATGISRVTAS